MIGFMGLYELIIMGAGFIGLLLLVLIILWKRHKTKQEQSYFNIQVEEKILS